MAKHFRYKVDKELEKKRSAADRSLHRAKCRFIKWDLAIRLGRMPTEDEIIGIALDCPLTILEVRESIRRFKRERFAKRKIDEPGEPVNKWDELQSPFQKRQTIHEEDLRMHLEFLRDCDLAHDAEAE